MNGLLTTTNNMNKLALQALKTHKERLAQLWLSEPKNKRVKEELKGGNSSGEKKAMNK